MYLLLDIINKNRCSTRVLSRKTSKQILVVFAFVRESWVMFKKNARTTNSVCEKKKNDNTDMNDAFVEES